MGKPIKVFLGGPNDCRDFLQKVHAILSNPLAKWNLAPFYFDTPGNKTLTDMATETQLRINHQNVNPASCDLMIMLFREKVGSPYTAIEPPVKYPSHSAYEVHTALSRNPRPKIVLIRDDVDRSFHLSPREVGGKSGTKKLREHQALLDSLARLDEYWNSLKNDSQEVGRRLSLNVVKFDRGLEESLTNLLKGLIPEIERERRSTQVPPADMRQRSGAYPYIDREFQIGDGECFFGRRQETDQILKRLETQKDLRMCVIQGPSGLGKSSLLQAGLLYQLTRASRAKKRRNVFCLFKPYHSEFSPFGALAHSLPREYFSDPDKLTGQIQDASKTREAAARAIEAQILQKLDASVRLIVAINQLEELWTRVKAEWTDQFLNFIAAAVESPRVLVLATIRDDYANQLQRATQILPLAQEQRMWEYPLNAPTEETLKEMIEKPGARVHPRIRFDRDFVKAISSDAVKLGDTALPLLSLMLQSMRLPDPNGAQVSHFRKVDYLALGPLENLVGKLAERAGTAQQPEIRDLLFHKLANITDSSIERRPVLVEARRQDLIDAAGDGRQPAMAEMIERLLESRLLFEHDGLVRLAYESLFDHWEELKTWHQNNAWDLALLAEQRRDATLWNRRRRRPEYLKLQLGRLEEIKQIARQHGVVGQTAEDGVLLDYLRACRVRRLRDQLIEHVKGGNITDTVKSLRSLRKLGEPPLTEEDRGSEVHQMKPAFWSAVTGDDHARNDRGEVMKESIFEGDEGPFEMARTTSKGITPIGWAAISGQADLVKKLLALGDTTWKRELEDESTIVQEAATGGNVEAISTLVDVAEKAGIDLLRADRLGSPPIVWAIQERNNDLVRYFLRKKQSFEFVTKRGFHAITEAARGDNLEIFDRLVSEGWNANKEGPSKWTPLHFACSSQRSFKVRVAQALVERFGADIHAKAETDSTPLHVASSEGGKFKAIDLLVNTARKAGDVDRLLNARDANGETPLHIACRGRDGFTTKRLLAAGADPNIVDNDGDPPLVMAAMQGDHRSAQALLAAGAIPQLCREDRWPALTYAADDGDVDMVEIILSARSADANVLVRPDWTPLMQAAANNRSGVVETLLRRGGNAAFVNRLGQDAMSLAFANGHLALVGWLKAWANGQPELTDMLQRQEERERRVAKGAASAAHPVLSDVLSRPREPKTLQEAIDALRKDSSWGSDVDAAAALGWTRTVRALIATGAPEPSSWKQPRVSAGAPFLSFEELDEASVGSLGLMLAQAELVGSSESRRYRQAALSFFPGWNLLSVEDTGTPGANEEFFIQGPNFLRRLNWTNETIYQAAERCPLRFDDDESVLNYCRFFFHWVRGILGRFIIVERPDQVRWTTPSARIKTSMRGKIHPLRIIERADNHFRVEARVIFKNALFKTDIIVAGKRMTFDSQENQSAPETLAIGQVQLTNEDLLAEDLPVVVDGPPGVFG